LGATCQRLNGLRIAEESVALGRELVIGPAGGDQTSFQRGFQRRDTPPDSGVVGLEPAGGGRRAPCPRQLQKKAQITPLKLLLPHHRSPVALYIVLGAESVQSGSTIPIAKPGCGNSRKSPKGKPRSRIGSGSLAGFCQLCLHFRAFARF